MSIYFYMYYYNFGFGTVKAFFGGGGAFILSDVSILYIIYTIYIL